MDHSFKNHNCKISKQKTTKILKNRNFVKLIETTKDV